MIAIKQSSTDALSLISHNYKLVSEIRYEFLPAHLFRVFSQTFRSRQQFWKKTWGLKVWAFKDPSMALPVTARFPAVNKHYFDSVI